MKRILLTGAAGFVGYHVARRLQERGDFVVGIDNFNDYYDPTLKREREKRLLNQGVEIHQGDVCNQDFIQQVFDDNTCTHVLHLAAQAGVRYSIDNPRAYVESNISGFLEVLELCRQRPGTPLVYASSSSVYGLNDEIPFSVSHRTDRPVSLYGATKKAGEVMAHSYHQLYEVPCTGLRFFTVYGPWGRPDMAYYSFAEAISLGKPIQVFNEGKMRRDFTYIDDIVHGVLGAVDLKHPSFALYNLGNSHAESLLDFIGYLEEFLGKQAEKIFMPMQKGDVVQTFADIDTARQDLGFCPKVSLKEGLLSFVEWFLQRRTTH